MNSVSIKNLCDLCDLCGSKKVIIMSVMTSKNNHRVHRETQRGKIMQKKHDFVIFVTFEVENSKD